MDRIIGFVTSLCFGSSRFGTDFGAVFLCRDSELLHMYGSDEFEVVRPFFLDFGWVLWEEVC